MTLKLLRLEAINLSYVVDDTEDLSTRRGGGYMLLQAVRDLTKSEEEFEEKSRAFKYRDKIKPVSTGASIGLFEVTGDINHHGLIDAIYDYLNQNSAYRHATFAVNIVQGDDFRMVVEQTISKVRWHQMQSLNFTTCWGDSKKVCKIDEVRPAPIIIDESKDLRISKSTNNRRKNGRKLRQEFYQRELGNRLIKRIGLDISFKHENDSNDAFTNDTENLSQFFSSTDGYKNIPTNLSGKMAVFYADGNSFGKIQQNCSSGIEIKQWDKYIKSKRRKLLAKLLACLQQTPLGQTSKKELRFETLLWGGDEVLFLIPAWLGLEFTQKFFELTEDWQYPQNSDNKLTHAAGLVFASHAAPISQLQKLAKKLADYGKATDKTQNTVSWIVLESFDHAGDNMDDYWQRSGIAQNGWQQLLLTQEKLKELRKTIIPLKDILPRSAIVRVLRSLAAGKADEEIELLRRSYESVDAAIEQAGEKEKEHFKNLWEIITQNVWQKTPETIPTEDAVAWTLLMELWDYILPDAKPDSTGGAQ